MHGGSALGMYTRGGQPQTLKRLEELLEDHYHHLSVDYYNDWGRNKEKQFPHLPRITHSVTCAGAFGHFFRSLFGLTACADSLRIAPAPLPQIEHFETLEPIFWGGKELRIAVSGKGTIHKVALDGKAIEIKDPDSVEVPFETLPNRTTLRFERK